MFRQLLVLGLLQLTVFTVEPVYGQDISAVYQRGRIASQHPRWDVGAYAAPYGYGWFAPPIYAGSWFQRPYPYHFDYYRWRYAPLMQAAPLPHECPCDGS